MPVGCIGAHLSRSLYTGLNVPRRWLFHHWYSSPQSSSSSLASQFQKIVGNKNCELLSSVTLTCVYYNPECGDEWWSRMIVGVYIELLLLLGRSRVTELSFAQGRIIFCFQLNLTQMMIEDVAGKNRVTELSWILLKLRQWMMIEDADGESLSWDHILARLRIAWICNVERTSASAEILGLVQTPAPCSVGDYVMVQHVGAWWDKPTRLTISFWHWQIQPKLLKYWGGNAVYNHTF